MRTNSHKGRLPKLTDRTRNFGDRNDGVKSLIRSSGGSTVDVQSMNGSESALRNLRSNPSDHAEGSGLPQYNAAIQDGRMTLALFIETKFVPEHVAFKASAGKTHYQAILKHLITPELVNRIFRSKAASRLKAVPDWPYLDRIRLCDLTADHVRRLILASEAAGYSSQTVKHIRNVFSAMVSHAQREGCFQGQNPASLVKLPKVVRDNQHNLTFQQTRAILELLPHPAKAIAVFTVTTSMNLKEIVDLRWKHVNLDDSDRYVDGEFIPAMSLAVRAAWNSTSVGNSRSAARNRNIEIREPLLSTLSELARLNPYPTIDTRAVISDGPGTISLSSFCINHLKEVGRALGMPWLTWQILRRARTSMVGDFLPHLSGSMMTDGASTSARILHSVEVFPSYRISGANNGAYADYRHRTFCFGQRFRQA
jgi:integrase